MSGDLEDFLRRAAERRRAKAGQTQQQRPSQRPTPEYTDRHRERKVHDDPSRDEPAIVEIVEEVEESLDDKRQRIQREKRALAATEHASQRAEQRRQEQAAAERVWEIGGVDAVRGGISAAAVLELLQKPGGMATAILLKEILERPEHRW